MSRLSRWCVVLAALVGCGEDDLISPPPPGSSSDQVAANLVLVSGDDQTGAVSTLLPVPLKVLTTNRQGAHVSARVQFEVTSGGGTFASGTAVEVQTSPDGYGEISWRLGSNPNQVQTVRVNLAGVAASPATVVTFHADARTTAVQVEILEGEGQTGPPGGMLPVPITVRVTDAFLRPVRTAIQFWVASGGGTLPGGIAVVMTTSDSGIATTHWRLGTDTSLVQTLVVTVVGAPVPERTTLTLYAQAVIPPPSELHFASVGAGHGYSCGLTTEGEVYCWGYRWSDWIVGICPDVSYYDWFPCGTPWTPPTPDHLYLTPVRVSDELKFKELSVGWRHACAITEAGAAYCWGYAVYGQAGGGTGNQLNPVPVAGSVIFKSISAGDSHTCGVAQDGAAYCWGLAIYGELGVGPLPEDGCPNLDVCNTPQRVAGGLSFASVSAGVSMTCGVTTTGAAWCWGQNAFGALGIGGLHAQDRCRSWFEECSLAPVAVAGGHSFISVSVLQDAACGLGTDHVMYCWGQEVLGFGPTPDDCFPWSAGICSRAPRPILGPWRFAELSATFGRACGRTEDGAVYCWGWDIAVAPESYYETPWSPASSAPVPIPGGIRFTSVSTGPSGHSCGLTASGSAYCWGDNSAGQLGDGTRTSSLTPVKVGPAM